MSSRVWESHVFDVPVATVWRRLRDLDFAMLFSSSVQSFGSQRIVKFSDGAQWTVLMREISDDQYTVTWEVVGTEPPAAFTSRVDTIRLRRVTHDNSTFAEWVSDFSSDASVEVTEDCRLKKLEGFQDMQRALYGHGAEESKGDDDEAADGAAAAGAARREGGRLFKGKGPKVEAAAGQGKIGGELVLQRNAPFLAARQSVFERIAARQRAELEAKPRVPIRVVLPDGREMEGVSWQTTPLDVANEISKGLAKNVVVARVRYTGPRVDEDGIVHAEEESEEEAEEVTGDGELWDLTRPLEGDCHLRLYKFEDREGRTAFWHSSAHVLGQCLEVLYGGKLCVGPPVQDGFFYDIFVGSMSITEKHYGEIEAQAKEIAKHRQPFERVVLTKEEALELFEDNPFKRQLILNKIPDGAKTTAYRCGPLVDLCTGPHLPDTSRVKAFAVTKNSSAYWLGETTNDTLQRVYAVSFPEPKQLQTHLHNLEEAKKRDHRRLGEAQELFFFHTLSPGSCFFQPHGAVIYNKLMDFIRTQYRVRGYKEVITPNLFNFDLWKVSGHALHYREDMFLLDCEGQEFGLKPMNCPGHCLMFDHRVRSHKELPLRLADFGVLHRNEMSGALSGLTRVRRFQQDDAHIFCREDQIKEEVLGVLDFMRYAYGTFGMTYRLQLSTRPKKALGDIELWNVAERALEEALNEFAGRGNWGVNKGDGAFYGPKIDIEVFDALGRKHQCATVQLDFQLPIRFDLTYRTSELVEKEDGTQENVVVTHRPVMVHRAILGSVERMMAILTEHFGGKWPFWLSPRQIMVIPANQHNIAYAQEVHQIMHSAGFETEADLTTKTIKKKVREAQLAQFNFMLVVGDREERARTVNIRRRGEEKPVGQEVSLEECIAMFKRMEEEHQ